MTSKEKVLKLYPEASCAAIGGWKVIYLDVMTSGIAAQRRESWAWAEALRRLQDPSRGKPW